MEVNMFWVGFCVGTAVCFVICMVGLSAMSWSVAKERSEASKKPDIPPALIDYWDKAHFNIDIQNQRLSEILDKLASKN